MKKEIFILFAIMAILVGACVFTDNEVYNVEPVPGDPPTISVSTNLDTIMDPEVIDSLEVTYQVEIQNGNFYLANAWVSDSLLYGEDTINGSFWIPNVVVDEPGIDTLKLYFYYSTNSNSLADIVGIESNVLDLVYAVNFTGGSK